MYGTVLESQCQGNDIDFEHVNYYVTFRPFHLTKRSRVLWTETAFHLKRVREPGITCGDAGAGRPSLRATPFKDSVAATPNPQCLSSRAYSTVLSDTPSSGLLCNCSSSRISLAPAACIKGVQCRRSRAEGMPAIALEGEASFPFRVACFRLPIP